MPNWVRNKLFIHGDADTVKQCTLNISTDTEHISFNKILPIPENIGDGWYDWCNENWGTKWDVRESFEDDEGYICFDTAWSTPMEVITHLSEIYKDLKFEVSYADEDLGHNCGVYEVSNGKIILVEPFDLEKACELWGYDFASFYPEIYRDRQISKIISDE